MSDTNTKNNYLEAFSAQISSLSYVRLYEWEVLFCVLLDLHRIVQIIFA